MGQTIVSAQNTNGFVFAHSDGEMERHLQEALQASNDEYAFRTQLEEALHLSNFTVANDQQLADIASSSPISNPPSSKDGASSSPCSKDEASASYSKDKKEEMTVNYCEQDNGFESRGYGGEKGEISRGKEVDTGLEQQHCRVQTPVPLELCGICYDDSAAGMFDVIPCLHRFCHPCMTKYIHTQLDQKRHQIYCPHELCGEPLTPQQCWYFLPAEIIDAWSAVTLEAKIPELELSSPFPALNLEVKIPQSQKVCCPFLDCSAMLVKEDLSGLSALEIVNAECPFCNRIFCVRCMVPWHADLDCEEFKKLPLVERSEADLGLFKLAENRKWQRCGKCKRMIERTYGCNHMTCRCGYEFCYECGTGWTGGRRNCNCPRRKKPPPDLRL